MSNGRVQYACHEGVHVLRFVGEVRYPLAPSVGRFIEGLVSGEQVRGLVFDLTATTLIDSTNLGQIARAATTLLSTTGKRSTIISDREDINIVLASMGFDQIFDIVDSSEGAPGGATTELESTELESTEFTEDELASTILAAHSALMRMNAKNHDMFQDMVTLLEQQQQQQQNGARR